MYSLLIEAWNKERQKRFILKSNDAVESINIQVARAMLVKLKATMCIDIQPFFCVQLRYTICYLCQPSV